MITIDISNLNQFIIDFFNQFSGLSAFEIVWLLLFQYWGWLIVVYLFLRFFVYPEYMFYIWNKWDASMPASIILAVDVPKRNEQSIQAMENFFDHLLGAHGTITLWGKYIVGEFQRSLSVELVSIEGNVQFLIRCPGDWRNLVEAAVYGQFPDAEITEVNDYVNSVPKIYPNETHDLWGCEFTLSNPNVYLPIKTYPKFEHRFSEVFVDPMAALLETMSSIGPGEQCWLQIILTPLAVDWGLAGGKKEINKILKVPPPKPKKGIISEIISPLGGIASEFTEQLAGVTLTGEPVEEKKENTNVMMNLSPGQKEQLEAMEHKISKLAFNTKVRYIYVAEKGKMNKVIGANGIVGAIKQWNDMNLNGLRPMLKETGTSSANYILIDYRRNARKNIIMSAYRGRSTSIGIPAKPMCSEELASFWHFPSMYVKAPLLKKTEYKKVAAPFSLPLHAAPISPAAASDEDFKAVEEKTQVTPSFDYDNDEFEMQFAKDKKSFVKSRPAREEKLKEIEKEEAELVAKTKEKPKVKEAINKNKKPTVNDLPFID